MIRLPRPTPTVCSYSVASGLMPIVEMTMSQSSVDSAPGIGSGLRRPESSGSPSRIFCIRTPLTAPSVVRTSSGVTRKSKIAPSASASSASTWWAGISARVRR